MQEWWEVLKGFEKNNLYLAECAQRVARMVNYEVPALKQQISRLKQTQRVRAWSFVAMMSYLKVT